MVKKATPDHFTGLNATLLISQLSYLGLPALQKEAVQ